MLSQGRQIIPADFFFNNNLEYLRGGSTDKKYTASTTKYKATRPVYTTLSNPQGVIYEDKLKQKRFMRADELHKFSDGTLISVYDTMSQMLHELHLGYNKSMRRRQWTRLDQQRTRIMIKSINQKLLDRRTSCAASSSYVQNIFGYRCTYAGGRNFEKYKLQVNEIQAKRTVRNANPLALVPATQNYPDDYYQAPQAPKP
ncbi:hypothetical protein Tco_1265552 [Tanacetum coccineum]